MKHIIILVSLLAFIPIHGQAQNQAYSDYLLEIEKSRIEFGIQFTKAENKDAVIREVREYLLNSYENIFEYWYGTKWDFNGTSRVPGEGSIACGYFVTNTLVDLGFNIPRIKWAQSASEVFISKLAERKDIKRFSNRPVSEIRKYLLFAGRGIYLVGLDQHVGFIVVNSEGMRFIHANYYSPDKGVMSEKLNSENPLKYSKYRIIGKLFSDRMLMNWMNKRAY
jgi:hypothetical protein